MLRKGIYAGLILALLVGSIVVPAHRAVNVHPSDPQLADGSPMPIPKPPADLLVADGSPMPIPRPPVSLLPA